VTFEICFFVSGSRELCWFALRSGFVADQGGDGENKPRFVFSRVNFEQRICSERIENQSNQQQKKKKKKKNDVCEKEIRLSPMPTK
jgi:hypothetical protein